jgi:RNA polymerase sigma factor (TIGR02999 family)
VPTISPQEVTLLLADWSKGDRSALDRLLPLVHAELRKIARRQINQERPGHTLQATALINEAYLKLLGQEGFEWHNRAHFFAVCAQIMRHILIDHARAHARDKRGGGAIKVSLHDADAAMMAGENAEHLIALEDALRFLERVDSQKGRIVELRFFGGLSIEETADVLNISPRTVRREWQRSKAWLYRMITEGTGDETRPLAKG